MSSEVNRMGAQRRPEVAHPTLVWEVMGRLDAYERRQRLTKRWLAGAGLAVVTWVAHKKSVSH